MEVFKRKGIKGYKLSDIKKELGERWFKEFQTWAKGQTVQVYKGEEIVFTYDFERFLAGLEPLD